MLKMQPRIDLKILASQPSEDLRNSLVLLYDSLYLIETESLSLLLGIMVKTQNFGFKIELQFLL